MDSGNECRSDWTRWIGLHVYISRVCTKVCKKKQSILLLTREQFYRLPFPPLGGPLHGPLHGPLRGPLRGRPLRGPLRGPLHQPIRIHALLGTVLPESGSTLANDRECHSCADRNGFPTYRRLRCRPPSRSASNGCQWPRQMHFQTTTHWKSLGTERGSR